MTLGFITWLLVFQLLGEVISKGFGLPLPGPVVGMALLFVVLVVRGELPDGLKDTAAGLLKHLSLLFVPAGVGVMMHLHLLQDEWQAISAALLVSTLATIAVTALVMKGLIKLKGQAEQDQADE
ncbi:CidA/LrgA family protein [Magnetovibrio blakemorei]|uniref:Murein hydrolase transporter LrgA n=1 Tax=Magnetovibrio blakemorei TaxID=28181 RepID=A0A1E5Q7M5_9PROT|nr:CidA/LrgA family protein [Magnetovibrio blakemorei]OEJ67140.1 murein hydrolase transporter LrgA [Magnetovibrio blakemorei]